MSSLDPSDLHKRRHLLGNPYAHIEQLIELEPGRHDVDARIRESRLLLQNQYAYLDGSGGFSAADLRKRDKGKSRTFKDIEGFVIKLQLRLWDERFSLWPNNPPGLPVDVLDPSMAAKLIGFKFEVVDSLGVYTDRAEKVVVAGLIDRSKNTIKVSRDLLPAAQNFTAAHELGHAVLHPQLQHLHRDRAIDGSVMGRNQVEREADKFAAYFLLPAKLVRKAFAERFLTGKFVLNENTSFALFGGEHKKALGKEWGRRALARTLASATYYNGQNFYSLAEYFNVSVETVAIRLEELSLIE
jgi:Zn-dependent peptidase ImmA (M78 family)